MDNMARQTVLSLTPKVMESGRQRDASNGLMLSVRRKHKVYKMVLLVLVFSEIAEFCRQKKKIFFLFQTAVMTEGQDKQPQQI